MSKQGISIIIVGATMLLVACLWIWREKTQEEKYAQKRLSYGVTISTPKMEEAAKLRRSRFLARAMEARESYRPWAQANKDLLLAIRKLAYSDDKAIYAIYRKLPDSPEKAGIIGGKFSDEINTPADLTDPNKFIFTWQVSHNKTMFEGAMPVTKGGLKDLHDIPLSVSVSGIGGDNIILWASGRITERKMVKNPIIHSGSPSLVETQMELAPAYF